MSVQPDGMSPMRDLLSAIFVALDVPLPANSRDDQAWIRAWGRRAAKVRGTISYILAAPDDYDHDPALRLAAAKLHEWAAEPLGYQPIEPAAGPEDPAG